MCTREVRLRLRISSVGTALYTAVFYARNRNLPLSRFGWPLPIFDIPDDPAHNKKYVTKDVYGDWQARYIMIDNLVLQVFLSKNYHQWKL